MDYHFVTLDVFSDTAFGGNPLAVVLDAEGLSDEAMQTIAREFNLSETAFVLPQDDPHNTHQVRIFTPQTELPFAGHPTLGTAIALAERDGVTAEEYRFEERVGVVPVKVNGSAGQPLYAELSVAKLPEQTSSTLTPEAWAEVLSLDPDEVCPDGTQPSVWSCGPPFAFVPVWSHEALAKAQVNMAAWNAHLSAAEATEVFVFTLDTRDADYDVQARMFAPGLGIAEDPATGSAVAALAGWLFDYLRPSDGIHRWTVAQGIEMGRPSLLTLDVDISEDAITAVRVGGYAVSVSRGILKIPEHL